MSARTSADGCLARAPRATASPDGIALGIVVVLFHPTAQQIDRLKSLASRAAILVVVDNSMPPLDPIVAAEPGGWRAVWLQNGNVGGLGAAYNLGADRVFALGADACLLLDQDSSFDERFLEGMVDACATCLSTGQRRFILGPKVLDSNTGGHVPSFDGGRFHLRAIAVGALDSGQLVRCSMLINSGSVISREARFALGPWREDFHLDHVDSEYCLRASRLGVPCWIVPWLTLHHSVGSSGLRRFLGIRVPAMNHSASRRYYLARNALALARHHPGRPLAVLLYNVLTLSQCLAVILVERGKAAKLHAMAVGVLDALLRRSGPLERWHPRLAKQWLGS